MRKQSWMLWVAALCLAGCGSGAYASGTPTVRSVQTQYADDTSVRSEVMRSAAPPQPYAFESENISGDAAPAMAMEISSAGSSDSRGAREEAPRQYADATPPVVTPVAGTAHANADQNARVADDAHRGPLLIYTATVHLSVFEVERTQRAIIEAVRELDGFLQIQNDNQVTVRVPAANFRDALARIEQTGDVLHRNVEALDVSDEFRDLGIRLQNAIAIRDRLQILLGQAHDTDQALAVERELERVTLTIEQIRGRMQLLGDRLAFSTITVMFQTHVAPTDQPGAFRLPVPWLDELSLSRLLTLPYED